MISPADEKEGRSKRLLRSDPVRALVSLNTHKGAGPDDVHPAILRVLAHFIDQPLTDLVNLSQRTASIPDDWRSATVCPIFKKGDREDAGNYRPVSLTSIVCKIMESILKTSMMNHLIQTAAISDAQHGFVPRRPCLPDLLLTEQWVMELIDDGETVDMVLLDFAKAFHSVNHRMVCLKH